MEKQSSFNSSESTNKEKQKNLLYKSLSGSVCILPEIQSNGFEAIVIPVITPRSSRNHRSSSNEAPPKPPRLKPQEQKTNLPDCFQPLNCGNTNKNHSSSLEIVHKYLNGSSINNKNTNPQTNIPIYESIDNLSQTIYSQMPNEIQHKNTNERKNQTQDYLNETNQFKNKNMVGNIDVAIKNLEKLKLLIDEFHDTPDNSFNKTVLDQSIVVQNVIENLTNSISKPIDLSDTKNVKTKNVSCPIDGKTKVLEIIEKNEITTNENYTIKKKEKNKLEENDESTKYLRKNIKKKVHEIQEVKTGHNQVEIERKNIKWEHINETITNLNGNTQNQLEVNDECGYQSNPIRKHKAPLNSTIISGQKEEQIKFSFGNLSNIQHNHKHPLTSTPQIRNIYPPTSTRLPEQIDNKFLTNEISSINLRPQIRDIYPRTSTRLPEFIDKDLLTNEPSPTINNTDCQRIMQLFASAQRNRTNQEIIIMINPLKYGYTIDVTERSNGVSLGQFDINQNELNIAKKCGVFDNVYTLYVVTSYNTHSHTDLSPNVISQSLRHNENKSTPVNNINEDILNETNSKTISILSNVINPLSDESVFIDRVMHIYENIINWSSNKTNNQSSNNDNKFN